MSQPFQILQICPRIPFPPDDGGKISVYHITRHLALRGHHVTMLTFGDPEQVPEELRESAAVVAVKHDTRTRITGIVRNLFSRLPYTISKYQTGKMLDALRNLCTETRFDLVHTDYPHMLPYGLAARAEFGLPVCHRAHDYETKIYRRYAEAQSLTLFKQYMRMQTRRIERWEREQLSRADVCMAITEEDAREIAAAVRVPVRVIPAGVDLEAHPLLDRTAEKPDSILILGSLSWQPNLDAVRWFLDEIFPLILREAPEATVTVAGLSPTRDILDRQNRNIQVPGFVEDLQSLIAGTQVLAVPLRIGGGMRIKLLEFFSHGKAVVSTTIGAEGNRARPGEQYLRADTPEAFAAEVLSLFRSPERRAGLGDAARRFVEEQYSWSMTAAAMEEVYSEVLRGKR